MSDPVREKPSFRPATLADIPRLVALENRIFTTDQLSAKSFRHLMTRGNSATIVEEKGGEIRAYVTLLFNRARPVAHIYTFAVAPEHRGKGLAKAIVVESVRVALKHGCTRETVDARKDNPEAQGLYQATGFHIVGAKSAYYEDGMDAVSFLKPLVPEAGTKRA